MGTEKENRVLIIDDDTTLRSLLEMMDESGPIQWTFWNHMRSLATIPDNAPEVDLIAVDYFLRPVTGLEFATTARGKWVEFDPRRILIFSSLSSDSPIARSVIDSGFRYVEKPLSLFELPAIFLKVLQEVENS